MSKYEIIQLGHTHTMKNCKWRHEFSGLYKLSLDVVGDVDVVVVVVVIVVSWSDCVSCVWESS